MEEQQQTRHTFIGTGCAYHPDSASHLSPGCPLHFVKEPENKYDKNAILINDGMGKPVGHLPKEQSARWCDVSQETLSHMHAYFMGFNENRKAFMGYITWNHNTNEDAVGLISRAISLLKH